MPSPDRALLQELTAAAIDPDRLSWFIGWMEDPDRPGDKSIPDEVLVEIAQYLKVIVQWRRAAVHNG